jgi:hypothetical protein
MAKRIALGLSAVLGVYVFFAASRGFVLLKSNSGPVQVLGLAIIALTGLGAYLVYRELRFGFKTAELGRVIDEVELPTRSMDSEALDSYLELAIEKAQAQPQEWTVWYCVALGYHLHSDRKLARESMRYAVELYEKASKVAGSGASER